MHHTQTKSLGRAKHKSDLDVQSVQVAELASWLFVIYNVRAQFSQG